MCGWWAGVEAPSIGFMALGAKIYFFICEREIREGWIRLPGADSRIIYAIQLRRTGVLRQSGGTPLRMRPVGTSLPQRRLGTHLAGLIPAGR